MALREEHFYYFGSVSYSYISSREQPLTTIIDLQRRAIFHQDIAEYAEEP